MDLKQSGSVLYQVGLTRFELGGSHWALVADLKGGQSPRVDVAVAKATFAALHRAIHSGFVRACHDLSEGGLTVAAAEMAFAGGLGVKLSLKNVPHNVKPNQADKMPGGLSRVLLFAESNSRFLVEVPRDRQKEFEKTMGDVPHAVVGEVTEAPRLVVDDLAPVANRRLIEIGIDELKTAWQKPLNW